MNETIAFFKSIVCEFKGHKMESHLTETDVFISTRRCARCHGTSPSSKYFTWKLKQFVPPNSTPEQVKSWELYCENHWQELRDSV